ncbi:MAG: PHP domain-containing protein [Clostridia bacterium]|nr:PHP domain-containing protein [Clostridia bacterium]
MKRYTYDFHVHSCLSPCADNDNTPNNIAGMASLCGIEIMALTDHNTSKNCPAFFEAARRYGIVPVGGMELTTSEDVHVICLFDSLEATMAFDQLVDSRRIKIKNRPEIFGDQLILNGEDEPIGTEEDLLINATSISLEEVPALVQPFGGVAYPAHIDREANGIIAVLGDFPKTPFFSCVELHDAESTAAYTAQYHLQDKKILVSSDAHRLTDFRDENDTLPVDDEPYSSALVRRRVLDFLR